MGSESQSEKVGELKIKQKSIKHPYNYHESYKVEKWGKMMETCGDFWD